MSIEALNWVWGSRRGPGLTGVKGAPRLCLIALANHANDAGESWPAIDTIAREANVHRDTAKDGLTWLIDHGYIERDVKGAPLGKGERVQTQRNLYRLRWDVERGESPPAESTPEGGHLPTQRGVVAPARGGSSTSKRAGDTSLFEPTVETNGEPATADAAAVLTPGQVCNRLQRDYWEWVRSQTGRWPVGITVPAFNAVVTPFLAAGVTALAVAKALKAMYAGGVALTKQSLERHLDGRGSMRQHGKTATMAKLSAARFDDDGNLVVG